MKTYKSGSLSESRKEKIKDRIFLVLAFVVFVSAGILENTLSMASGVAW